MVELSIESHLSKYFSCAFVQPDLFSLSDVFSEFKLKYAGLLFSQTFFWNEFFLHFLGRKILINLAAH